MRLRDEHMPEDGKKGTRRIVLLGMFLSFALLLGYVETLLPLSFSLQGMKLGLANLAVVLAFYCFDIREAFLIDILRIVLCGFLFGSLYSLLYSLAGGLLSFMAMVLFFKTGKFSISGISIAGGVFHNIGQLIVAACIVETGSILYYLPPLLVSGTVTGFLIGIVAGQVQARVFKNHINGEGKK